ncbi:ABC-2 type transport system permease protein [Chryseolinea serpens]|uniref:ABC-2 type transport system permease protein n=1 Tax=Chryseolinea serpens TaxID=947013 RepID=A0A1M5WHW4_9BACT|nr:ABC transporter permease [Chryseolinea serpens]SHH86794.1 ABC-2 type transport system permease protein [Chryseolinea serpens]
MNKIFLIIQREFLNRVQKKSFLIATIVLPLIFPAIMAVLVYFSIQQRKNATRQTIQYVDESGLFVPDTSKFVFKKLMTDVKSAKEAFQTSDDYGLLYIPHFELSHPDGVTLYTKINPSPNDIGNLEGMLENQIRELKMKKFNVDQKVLDSLKTDVPIENFNVADAGQEKKSNSNVLLGVGVAAGILMYMFIFIYGAQIMQGIIEEKTSKVVEVIVSSVRPFQLMMGKIIGLASVGLLQFLIWIVLITTLSSVVLAYFGVQMPQQQMMQEMAQNNPDMQAPPIEILKMMSQIPFGYVIFNFLFYFLGGYLLYGALFAAVGSAVDSPAEAQQFMFPITIPLLISYFGLFTFIMNDPHSTVSVWLSIIPFTSPIAMMGRIAFGVPGWQLALSMVSLILGFMLTTWVAGRIYRVGILMHGTKINYKVMAKWFMMKG